MKKLLLLALTTVVALSCSKDDGVGAYAISGTPEITSLKSGYNRIEVTWQHNTSSDESNYTNIYWNGGNNSSGMSITSSSASTITLEVTNVAEGDHTFYVQNVNTLKGEQSAESTPITIYVYGAEYCKGLAQRTIASLDYIEATEDSDDSITLTWDTAPSDADFIGNALYYTDRAGDETTKFCPKSDNTTDVDNALVATEFDYATLYHPEGSLDTLASTATLSEFPYNEGSIITVASLKAMQPYFKMDDVHVRLETGEYLITPADINNGDFPSYGPRITEDGDTGNAIVTPNARHSLFLIEGNGSTYDFGGSKITVLTTVYQLVGSLAAPLRFTGNYNTVTNIELIDEGEAETTESSITNVTMDGKGNILDNLTLRSTGSFPYRYGEVFGKGFYTIRHSKHCGVLVRGDDNIFQNSHVYHYAYGHCVFMQGAENPTIQNCYIESQMGTTEAIWAEKGTGSPADEIDFLTTWGFFIDATYKFTMALSEEGIRAYGSGETIIDGVGYIRGGALNPRIIGNTIKNARAGVTLTHAVGSRYVKDCITIGCDRGYAIGTGEIINCQSDAQFGPAFGVDYGYDSGVTAEITLIDGSSATQIVANDGVAYPTSNGSGHVAYIQGSNHLLKFRDGRGEDSEVIYTTVNGMVPRIAPLTRFDLGGSLRNIGEIWEAQYDMSNYNFDWILVPTEYLNQSKTLKDDKMSLTSTKFANQTHWLVYVDENVSGCYIYTNGDIWIEKGAKNNNIYVKSVDNIRVCDSDDILTYDTVDSLDPSNTITYGEWDINTCF